MIKVYVKLDEVWNYFQSKKEHFKDAMDCVAEVLDNETENPLVKVYLTEEKGYPLMTAEQVCENGNEEVIEKKCAISAKDCSSVYKDMLVMLEIFDAEIHCDSETDKEDFDIVLEREYELRESLSVFLSSLMGFEYDEEIPYDGGKLDEILDAIEELLFEIGYVIYRPRIVEKNGKKVVVDSLYEECEEYLTNKQDQQSESRFLITIQLKKQLKPLKS